MTDLKMLVRTEMERAGEPTFGMDDVVDRRDRRRRNKRIAAGAVGFAVFVTAIWIVMTGGPVDRTQSPTPGGGGATGPTAPPPHPAGVGLWGFPPEGATPSTPERGELVVGFVFGHSWGDSGRFGLHVYEDGRVIWQRLGLAGLSNESTGLIEQRLTPEGVELVIAEVLSTGYFHRDRDRELIVPLGDLTFGWIEVRTDRLERLTWGDTLFVGRAETTATPADIAALMHLDARLEDLTSWLPRTAWADAEYRAYVPARYSVCYGGSEPRTMLDRPRILDLLPAPVGDALRPLDTVGPWNPSAGFWCSPVTTDEARTLAAALEDAGASRNAPDWPSYRFAPPSGPEIDIGFDPLLPHD